MSWEPTDPFSGFSVDFGSVDAAAAQLQESGSKARGTGGRLTANTQTRAGHGEWQWAQDLLDRMMNAFADGVSNGLAGHYEGTAHILQQNAKKTHAVDAEVERTYKSIGNRPDQQSSGGVLDRINRWLGTSIGSETTVVGSRTAGEIDKNLADAKQHPVLGPVVDGYRPYGHLTVQEFMNKYWDPDARNGQGGWRWPKNDGELENTGHDVQIPTGTVLTRFGEHHGKYVSQGHDALAERAIAPDALGSAQNNFDYHVYEVIQPIPARMATIAPWFEQPGMGTQYKVQTKIKDLIDHNYVVEHRLV
jgi:hypothetical protein